MKRTAVLLLCLLAIPAQAQEKRPMQVDDLFRFKRVSDPQISPDGKWIVHVVGTVVGVAGNKTTSNLWLVSTDGKMPRRLTTADKRDSHPRWSPDSKRILFQSNRSGSLQLWVIDADGGEARQLTNLSTEASDPVWSPDGKRIAFVSAVWPEFSTRPFAESDALNRKKIEEREKNPVKAKVFTRLFYRHWDEYVGDKRQHLFVMSFGGRKAGEPHDVTPGDLDAFPTSTTFSSGEDFTFSPDGTHLVYTAPPRKNEAWSTNYDIWRVAIDGTGKPENLTQGNKAADSGPQFSPDGKWLAYRKQKKAGSEADKWELAAVPVGPDGTPTGKEQVLTKFVDRSVDGFLWLPKTPTLVYDVENQGGTSVYLANPGNEAGPRVLFDGPQLRSFSASADGKTLAFTSATLNSPPEVAVHRVGEGAVHQVTHANKKLLSEIAPIGPESVTVKGADGTPMQMWILKPPGFDPMKKWPVVYLVHGGPQGAWTDGWSYRWNPKLWAAQGYVVALPNPRGSTGFGQKYVDEISGDWGGKCYTDLMKGVDWLEQQPWVDKDRIGAAGASFGGYMMNWFAVNTGRFKTLITHCSVWNFESMYATTDELWFDEWEHGGPPWGKNRAAYEKHSPHRFAANLAKFRTPMLVIHNDLDFRCPIGQGHELFTTLQRLGVPSRMVNFPDEGHWVLKPANSRYWHQEVFAWLKKHVPPGGRAR